MQAEKALFGELERSERACKAELDAVKARRPTAQRPVRLLGSLSTLPLPLTPSARTPPCFALSQTSAAHICAGTWARPCHICAGTGLTPATSAPGLGSSGAHARGRSLRSLSHLHQDCVRANPRSRHLYTLQPGMMHHARCDAPHATRRAYSACHTHTSCRIRSVGKCSTATCDAALHHTMQHTMQRCNMHWNMRCNIRCSDAMQRCDIQCNLRCNAATYNAAHRRSAAGGCAQCTSDSVLTAVVHAPSCALLVARVALHAACCVSSRLRPTWKRRTSR